MFVEPDTAGVNVADFPAERDAVVGEIGRLFRDDEVVRVEQRFVEHVQRLLRSGRDQYLVGGQAIVAGRDAVKARDKKILTADIEEGHLSSAYCHLGNIAYRQNKVAEWSKSV